MSYNHSADWSRDNRLENYAAQLTRAVYPLALLHGLKGKSSWLKLELDLWTALAKTVKQWARQRPPVASSGEFENWREELLVDLTETAFFVAVKHGIQGPFLELELDFYRAFRLMIRRRSGRRSLE
jgi:hypothetical protein